MVGVGILIPVIPQLFANPASPYYLLSATTSLKTGYFLLGLLTASYPLALFFAAPILGQLSDRFGRKPVLALSLFGTAIGYLLFAIGVGIGNIGLLFFARIFDGLTGGNISVAQAAIADVTEPKDRAKNFGLIGAAFGLGFIMGPFLGGKLADSNVVSWFSAQVPFYVAGVLALINSYLVIRFFKETHTKNQAVSIDLMQSLRRISAARKFKEVRVLFLVGFLMTAGFSFFTTFFNVFLVQRFSFTEGKIGNLFAFIGICVAITQGFITRLVAKRYKDTSILSWSYFATAIMLVAYTLPQNARWFLLITPLFAVANGLTQANAPALISRKTEPATRGEVMGINTGFMALAQAIPPLIAGTIAAFFAPSTPIIVGALFTVAAGWVFLTQRKHLA